MVFEVTDETFSENAWTQFDGRLILDGGTFRRSGESPAGVAQKTSVHLTPVLEQTTRGYHSAVALLSGGFDSAVSSWLMLKRGVEIEYVFCNLAGESYERSVVQVAKVLADDWSYGTRPRLHAIDFGPVLDELRTHSQPKYWQLVLKRLMYRAAEAVAREVRSAAIVTGEALGQVSSQTLANLAAIDPATGLVVFRPLLGFDKSEIIAIALFGTPTPSAGQQGQFSETVRDLVLSAGTIPRASLRERARRGHEVSAHRGPTEVRAIIPGRVVGLSIVPGDVNASSPPWFPRMPNSLMLRNRLEISWNAGG